MQKKLKVRKHTLLCTLPACGALCACVLVLLDTVTAAGVRGAPAGFPGGAVARAVLPPTQTVQTQRQFLAKQVCCVPVVVQQGGPSSASCVVEQIENSGQSGHSRFILAPALLVKPV